MGNYLVEGYFSVSQSLHLFPVDSQRMRFEWALDLSHYTYIEFFSLRGDQIVEQVKAEKAVAEGGNDVTGVRNSNQSWSQMKRKFSCTIRVCPKQLGRPHLCSTASLSRLTLGAS